MSEMMSIKKTGYEIGIINVCYDMIKQAEGSFFADKQLSKLITNFLDTESIPGLVKEIEKDKRLSDKEKNRLISGAVQWQNEYTEGDKTGHDIGRLTGMAGGLFLGYMLTRNVESSWLRGLLMGTAALTSGAIGGAVGDKLTSRHYSLEPKNIRYNRWKGF